MGTPYRHWRLRIVGRVGYGTGNRIYWFELRESADGSGTNLAVPANGSYSAAGGGGWSSVANAFDGSNATYATISQYATDTSEPTLQFDFGSGNSRDINHFSVGWFAPLGYALTALLEASADASAWTRVSVAQVPSVSNTFVTVSARSNWPAIADSQNPSPLVILGTARPFPGAPALVQSTFLAADIYDGGTAYLDGITDIYNEPDAIPVSRKVLLIRERDRRVIRETWSRASDGYYRFEGIAPGGPYTVLTIDHLRAYRAVAADNLYARVP